MPKKINTHKKLLFFRSARRISLLVFFITFFFGLGGWYIYQTYFDSQANILEGLNIENADKIQLEKQLAEITAGYPMEKMVPYILEKDPKVAAFLVSIAKKESNWGKHSPVLDGQDCYNYWGYREVRERMGTGGHTCFDNPQDAINTVAKRLENLVEKDVDTPKEMVVWKCGSTCQGHNQESVQKWISDVSLYFKKIYTH